jgi:hypothetical protein
MKSFKLSCLSFDNQASIVSAFRACTLMKMAICTMLAVGSVNAEAAPLTWTVDGVTFNDGGSANGSFVYDADTGMYSDIAINTTAGTILGGTAYPDVLRGDAFFLDVVPDASLASLTGSLLLNINFASPLTNAGGTIDIFIISEGFCQNAACTVIDGTDGRGAGLPDAGSVTAVPLPTAVWLFGSGLLGMIGVARRKKPA